MTTVVHPQTDRQLAAFRQTPSHALILNGPAGSGKLTLARQLIEDILKLPPNSFPDYAYGLTIVPAEGRAISIEAVRQLEHFLSLKVPINSEFNRAVIIEDSHLLTLEAQNALLKTLEEPPAGTIIVLTTAQEQALLPTIRSRAVSLDIRRPEKGALQVHFQSSDFDRFYALSSGLPGLMSALLTDEEHPLKVATQKARQLLSQSTYERLTVVDELSRKKTETLDVLFILQNMAHISLQKTSGPAARHWQRILQTSYETQAALQHNALTKLALTQLMLQL